MGQQCREIVRQFVLQGWRYELVLAGERDFILALTNYPDADPFYSYSEDQDFHEFGDIGARVQVFKLARLVTDLMVDIVKSRRLHYFRFFASTARKSRIYGRFAKRLADRLGWYCHSPCGGYYTFTSYPQGWV